MKKIIGTCLIVALLASCHPVKYIRHEKMRKDDMTIVEKEKNIKYKKCQVEKMKRHTYKHK